MKRPTQWRTARDGAAQCVIGADRAGLGRSLSPRIFAVLGLPSTLVIALVSMAISASCGTESLSDGRASESLATVLTRARRVIHCRDLLGFRPDPGPLQRCRGHLLRWFSERPGCTVGARVATRGRGGARGRRRRRCAGRTASTSRCRRRRWAPSRHGCAGGLRRTWPCGHAGAGRSVGLGTACRRSGMEPCATPGTTTGARPEGHDA